jgi:hypothetical protein
VSQGYEMSRPWFKREARLGLRVICEFHTHPNVPQRRRHIVGIEFRDERDLSLFVRNVSRGSAERDYEDLCPREERDFPAWAEAETWMRGA